MRVPISLSHSLLEHLGGQHSGPHVVDYIQLPGQPLLHLCGYKKPLEELSSLHFALRLQYWHHHARNCLACVDGLAFDFRKAAYHGLCRLLEFHIIP